MISSRLILKVVLPSVYHQTEVLVSDSLHLRLNSDFRTETGSHCTASTTFFPPKSALGGEGLMTVATVRSSIAGEARHVSQDFCPWVV